MKLVKPITSLLLAAALASALALPAFAADTTQITGTDSVAGTIGVAGEVTSGLTITVTVPTAMSFALTPDAENPVITTPVAFSNQTKAAVKVSFLGMSAKGETTAKVVAPDKFEDWSALRRADTEGNIALGLKEGDAVLWAHPEGEAASGPDGEILLGAAGGAAESKEIGLEVKAGNAWGESAELAYDMNLKITLAD